jgi:hypothetical protein
MSAHCKDFICRDRVSREDLRVVKQTLDHDGTTRRWVYNKLMTDKKRDRRGEPFQNDFTENTGADRVKIEEAQSLMRSDPDIDSQEADSMNKEFARRIRAIRR